MSNSNDSRFENVYSKKVKAGSRRTYFFDVRKRVVRIFNTLTEIPRNITPTITNATRFSCTKRILTAFFDPLQEVVEHVQSDLMPSMIMKSLTANRQNGKPPTKITQDGESPREACNEDIAWCQRSILDFSPKSSYS
jgi:hypothetical protein